MKAAFVTLVTRPTYLVGALVLHLRLLAVGSQYPLVVLVTAQLPIDARTVLEKRGIKIREVEALRPEEGRHYLDYHDRRFADTWTKLR